MDIGKNVAETIEHQKDDELLRIHNRHIKDTESVNTSTDIDLLRRAIETNPEIIGLHDGQVELLKKIIESSDNSIIEEIISKFDSRDEMLA